MATVSKWTLSDAEKDRFIAELTPHLVYLRTQAEILQEDLANIIGVSRQTYSAIERKVRRMSWNTYLSLILFYDYNQKTHRFMRQMSLLPTELLLRFNEGSELSEFKLSHVLGENTPEIIGRLDERALQTVRQTILTEYARCTRMPEGIVKAFDGAPVVTSTVSERDIQALNAIRAILADADKHE